MISIPNSLFLDRITSSHTSLPRSRRQSQWTPSDPRWTPSATANRRYSTVHDFPCNSRSFDWLNTFLGKSRCHVREREGKDSRGSLGSTAQRHSSPSTMLSQFLEYCLIKYVPCCMTVSCSIHGIDLQVLRSLISASFSSFYVVR